MNYRLTRHYILFQKSVIKYSIFRGFYAISVNSISKNEKHIYKGILVINFFKSQKFSTKIPIDMKMQFEKHKAASFRHWLVL